MQKNTYLQKRGRPTTIVMSLRTRAAICLMVLAGLVLAAIGPFAKASSQVLIEGPEEQRPNILIIMTDDQRNDLTGMPQTRKAFRQQGREFLNSFAATPNCCPSRASVFSGRYSHNHGVRNNRLAFKLDHSTTIQRYLDDEGYRTSIFGKFLNEWDVHDDPPFFD
jgi:hypothetical protein